MASSSNGIEINHVEQNDWEWLRFKDETSLEPKQLSKVLNGRLSNGSQRVCVALIGLGRMGLIHLRNIIREPRANLLYCFDADYARLNSIAKSMFFSEYGIQYEHSDNFEVLALRDKRIKAIIVATPSETHVFYTRISLEAGKSVMCEKPLCLNTELVAPLFELASKHKVFLMVSFNRRYDPDLRQICKRVSKNKELGLIHSIRTVSRDSQLPPLSYISTSGDIFHDSIIHEIDLSIWFTKELPMTVQVMGKTWKEHYANEPEAFEQLSQSDQKLLENIDDYFIAVITLKFPSGAIGVIDNGRQACYGYDQRCEIHGVKGMIKCDGRKSFNIEQYNDTNVIQSPINFNFASRYSTAYVNELLDILTLAQFAHTDLYNDRETINKYLIEPNRPTLIEASLKVADACLKSSKLNRPIDLVWDSTFIKQFDQEMSD